MTNQERNQILKMIEEGTITPEQGLQLMRVIDQQIPEGEPPPLPPASAEDGLQGSAAVPAPDSVPDPHVERLKANARNLWQIPLWIGIFIMVLSALGMYAVLRGAGMNFWFFFLLLPLMLGVALTALAAGSRTARWIYVDVRQHPGEHPQRILLGFPLPLGLTAWFLHTFGPMIPDLQRIDVDEIIQAIESGFSGQEPLIVHVDEGHSGERVQVYIG